MDTASESEHVDMSKARVHRDIKDVAKLVDWFTSFDPFGQPDYQLRSLSSGVTAVDGDGINCDSIEQVGATIHQVLDGVAFTDAVLRKKNQVKTLVHLQKGVVVNNKKLFVHSTQLFDRLLILADRNVDAGLPFAYELTPLPASLFKESVMRKPDKANLGRLLSENATVVHACAKDSAYVLDGGCLLHQVKWPPKNASYRDIADTYMSYVYRNCGNDGRQVTIIFDGYGNGPSTKDHEHLRRTGKTSAPNITVEECNTVSHNQETFLSNEHNKDQLIKLLMRSFSAAGHTVIQASDDADCDIARAALSRAKNNRVVVVTADDTDILVLLLYHFSNEMGDIYLNTSGKRKLGEMISIRSMKVNFGVAVCEQILAIHALGGCDTTSALYGKGKAAIFKKLTANECSRHLTDIIGNEQCTADEVAEAGCQLLVTVYGGKSSDSLNGLRHSKYNIMVSKSKATPEKLPPTERAAYFHCLRVHLQVCQWKLLNTCVLDPMEWGWQLVNSKYEPVPTDKEPGPPELLKVIRCSCKPSARSHCDTSKCTCRRNGLTCITACGNCRGTDCSNVASGVTCDSDDADGDDFGAGMTDDGAVFNSIDFDYAEEIEIS
jgi:hypothetical protein